MTGVVVARTKKRVLWGSVALANQQFRDSGNSLSKVRTQFISVVERIGTVIIGGKWLERAGVADESRFDGLPEV